jgi:hypothetical protein
VSLQVKNSELAILAEAKRLMDYDPETGVFIWKANGIRRKAGEPAGANDGSGYLSIWLLKKPTKLHRVAWLWMHGWLPKYMDHINGDRRDNRISNLRPATQQQNIWNRVKKGKYLRGVYKGVRGRYRAMIQLPGMKTKLTIGTFNTEEEAHDAYMAVSRVVHGEFCPERRLRPFSEVIDRALGAQNLHTLPGSKQHSKS